MNQEVSFLSDLDSKETDCVHSSLTFASHASQNWGFCWAVANSGSVCLSFWF